MSEIEIILPMPKTTGMTADRLELLEKLGGIIRRVISDQMESGDIPRRHMHDAAIMFDLIAKYESLTGQQLTSSGQQEEPGSC